MNVTYAILCALVAFASYMLYKGGTYSPENRAKQRACAFACSPDGDEDIKIATGIRTGEAAEDPAETAARNFLEQKTSGNIDKAKLLGIELADAIIKVSESYDSNSIELHQRLLLNAYVVNHVIAEYSPNSILGQTSLRMFYKRIEENSDDLYSHISDMAAFSLYILCDRSANKNGTEIGKIYANLCGFNENEKYINEGNRIYKEFYNFCVDKILRTSYREI